ncbi:MAG: hypothetical protein JO199_07795, partial [Candidatus Eremiobacteraeota bacterium]|nr:hypothetical protein [Candidatus Eremiobacteraeota bacterium]
DIGDLPAATIEQIKKFLVEYPLREGEQVRVRAVVGAADAMRSVKKCAKVYKKCT